METLRKMQTFGTNRYCASKVRNATVTVENPVVLNKTCFLRRRVSPPSIPPPTPNEKQQPMPRRRVHNATIRSVRAFRPGLSVWYKMYKKSPTR